MARVYACASRVIVWLGVPSGPGDPCAAIRTIRKAASEPDSDYELPESALKDLAALYSRSWFTRVWVIQEVAAAQNVIFMCGDESLTGHAFCLGISSKHYSALLAKVSKSRWESYITAYLIRRVTSTPTVRTGTDSDITESNAFSLNVRPLGELLDMFRLRAASDPRDKVYALLGMCSDELQEGSLIPGYTISWAALQVKLMTTLFGSSIQVSPSAPLRPTVIHCRTRIIGKVTNPTCPVSHTKFSDSKDHSFITMTFPDPDSCAVLRALVRTPPGLTFKRGDIMCQVDGSSRLSIVRPFDSHCVVIASTVLIADKQIYREPWYQRRHRLCDDDGRPDGEEATIMFGLSSNVLFGSVMVWDWDGGGVYPRPTEHSGPHADSMKWHAVVSDKGESMSFHSDGVRKLQDISREARLHGPHPTVYISWETKRAEWALKGAKLEERLAKARGRRPARPRKQTTRSSPKSIIPS